MLSPLNIDTLNTIKVNVFINLAVLLHATKSTFGNKPNKLIEAFLSTLFARCKTIQQEYRKDIKQYFKHNHIISQRGQND